jgi:hypothetical protein
LTSFYGHLQDMLYPGKMIKGITDFLPVVPDLLLGKDKD